MTSPPAVALSLLANWAIMRLRCSQLRVQSLTLAVAGLPGFAVAKQAGHDVWIPPSRL